jgi:hypothetical protein
METHIKIDDLIRIAVRELRFTERLLLQELRRGKQNTGLVDALVERQLAGFNGLRALLLRHQGGQSALLERYDVLFFQLQLDHLLIAKALCRSASV